MQSQVSYSIISNYHLQSHEISFNWRILRWRSAVYLNRIIVFGEMQERLEFECRYTYASYTDCCLRHHAFRVQK